MVSLSTLWLPILVASLIVFIAAALNWMVMPHHKNDFRGLPDEAGVLAALRKNSPAPGQYMFPYAGTTREGMNDEWKAKVAQGPSGIVLIKKGKSLSMARPLVQYFIWVLVIEIFVAYVTSRTVPANGDYLDVFQIAGTTAILGFAGAVIPNSIWFFRPWVVSIKEVIDGILYGLLSAGVFGWLWPRATDI